MNVAILGASDRPERYAYKAMKRLEEEGHKVFLVNPKLKEKEVEGHKVFPSLIDLPEKIHTLTMYVGPAISKNLLEDLCSLKAKRIIFNPGAENRELYEDIRSVGSRVEEACTLVLLNTDQF